jgi:hypothetical protein
MESPTNAPWGYDVFTHTEVVPKLPPVVWRWRIGPVQPKTFIPVPLFRRGTPRTPATGNEDITVQLTADQQVDLSITGQDRYGNPVDISGDTAWLSSDESIISVTPGADSSHATAVAVGPTGTASVTVTNDVNQDGTGDFQGSLAIDVVAGDIAEIEVQAGTPTDKPA